MLRAKHTDRSRRELASPRPLGTSYGARAEQASEVPSDFPPAERQLFAPLSVEDNLRLGAWTRRASDLTADIAGIFAMFPILSEMRHTAAGALSGGQQQMLAIGRALMSKPKLVLLDEPSMGLAPILVDQIFNIVAQLQRSGQTILLVEQNARAALAIADRGYVIETGRITVGGDAATLLADPRVQSGYLGV